MMANAVCIGGMLENIQLPSLEMINEVIHSYPSAHVKAGHYRSTSETPFKWADSDRRLKLAGMGLQVQMTGA